MTETPKNQTINLKTHINVEKILVELSEKHREYCQSRYIAKRTDYLTKVTSKDSTTITAETIQDFNAKWKHLGNRLEIIDGKALLSEFRTKIQSEYGINLTDFKIIDSFQKNEIPEDLTTLLMDLDYYRKL